MLASHIRRFLPLVVLLVVLGLVGRLIGHGFGEFVAILIGISWCAFALMGADRYGLTLYEGRLLSRIEAPNIHDMVDTLASEARIEQPVIYSLPVAQPNILVCCGMNARARLGVSQLLTMVTAPEETRALLALAVARIATGEAGVICTVSTAAALPLQLAHSALVNFTLGDYLKLDPECGLTPIGKAVVIIVAPFSWAIGRLGGLWSGCLRTDKAANRFLGEQAQLASGLEKVAVALSDPSAGGGMGYNPGTAPLFVVSPFEGADRPAPNLASRPLWLRARLWAARQTPPATVRASALREAGVSARPAFGRPDNSRARAENVTWPP